MAFWRQSTDARPVSTRGSQGYFKEILLSADDQIPILGLEQSSFFYCIAEDGIAQISGYLHVNKEGKLTEDAVRKEVRDTFKGILISANNRLPLCGVDQSSFSYDVPDDGIATIDGYLHVNSRLVQHASWISDVLDKAVTIGKKCTTPGL
jgi:hypothetical protein